MKDDNVISLKKPEGNFNDYLTDILRQGCARILEEALEVEIETFVEHYKHLKDERGRQCFIVFIVYWYFYRGRTKLS